MSLRFEKMCYPDVLDYKARKEKGLYPLPRKLNVWAKNSLARSGSDILGTNKKNSSGRETFRGSTAFTRGWKRQGYRRDLEKTKDLKKDKDYCVYTSKISTPDEREYGEWKGRVNKNTGAYNHPESIGFFKGKVNEAAPKWMQLKTLQTPAFFSYKKSCDDEKRYERQYKLDRKKNEDRTTAGSYETPNWFKTNRNGVQPIKNSRTVCHGNQTLLVSHHDKGISTGRGVGVMGNRPDLSLLENRTARHNHSLSGPHNRTKTDMVAFCDAAVKQGIKPFGGR